MGCFFCQASSSSGLLQTLWTPAAQAAQLGVSGIGGFREKLMERNLANNGIGIAISQGRGTLCTLQNIQRLAQSVGVG